LVRDFWCSLLIDCTLLFRTKMATTTTTADAAGESKKRKECEQVAEVQPEAKEAKIGNAAVIAAAAPGAPKKCRNHRPVDSIVGVCRACKKNVCEACAMCCLLAFRGDRCQEYLCRDCHDKKWETHIENHCLRGSYCTLAKFVGQTPEMYDLKNTPLEKRLHFGDFYCAEHTKQCSFPGCKVRYCQECQSKRNGWLICCCNSLYCSASGCSEHFSACKWCKVPILHTDHVQRKSWDGKLICNADTCGRLDANQKEIHTDLGLD
jgi:hypothetical protein